MAFDAIYNKVKRSNLIVFFDLEGTQVNHYPISIGLVAYEKKEDDIAFDFSKKFTYKAYIKTKEPIGSVVEEITGIDESLLDREGKTFHEVILDITKLLRPYHKCFVSYGYLDIKMISMGIEGKEETEMNFFRNVTKNYLDFHAYLYDRVTNEKGGAYSVAKWMKIFSLKQEGKMHDPLVDAIDLSLVYDAVIHHEDKMVNLILENYSKNVKTEKLNKKVVSLLREKKMVTYDDFITIIKDNL